MAELSSVEAFNEFLDNMDASVIGAFQSIEVPDPAATRPEGWDDEEDGEWAAPTAEHPVYEKFKAVKSRAYNYRFAFTTSPEVLAMLKQKSKAGVYLYRSPKFVSKEHGDRPRERYPSDTLAEDAVVNWLAAKAQPLVGLYNSGTQERYAKVPVLVTFFNLDFEANAKGTTYVLKRLRKVAAELKGKLSFAVASATEMSYDMGDFGLESVTKSKSDILIGIRGADGKFYKGTEAFSAKAVQAFADAFLAGTLEAYEKPPDAVPPAGDEDNMGEDDDEGEGMDNEDGDDEPKDEM